MPNDCFIKSDILILLLSTKLTKILWLCRTNLPVDPQYTAWACNKKMNGNNCRDAKELHPKREQRSLSWSEDANEGFRSVFCKEGNYWGAHSQPVLAETHGHLSGTGYNECKELRSSLSAPIFFNTEYLLFWLGLQHLHSPLSPRLIDH